MIKGSHHTIEAKVKNRKAHLGKPGHWLGKHHTEESIKKMSESSKGKIPTEETRQKISENNSRYWLGKHRSEETKQKISKATRGISRNKGENNYHYGKSPSIETRLKISLANKGKIRSKEAKEKYSKSKMGNTWNKGERNYNWKGGISFEPYTIQFNRQLKELIRNRDNYQCQLCGMPECENIRKLDVHHIDYNKKNCLPNNLISLCRKCHWKTNNNRNYWENYFRNKLNDEY